MSLIRNSSRAFIAALLVISAYHGVMSFIGIASFTASQMPLPPPDQAFQILMRRVVIDAGILLVGHRLLRSFGIATRLAYGLMGGAAMIVGYAFALTNGLMMWPPLPGAQVTAAILPALIGMIAGSIYAQLAGYEIVAQKSTKSTEPAATPFDDNFDGPVRVRSSMSATLIAAIIPAAIFAVLVMPLFALTMDFSDSMARINWSEIVLKVATPSYLTVVVLLVTAIPAAIITQLIHVIARSFNRMRGADYAMIGAGMGCIAALATSGFLFLGFSVPALALVGAIMGGAYRRFAGLEPLPLPEVVLAADRARLVAADHPSRKGHRVVLTR